MNDYMLNVIMLNVYMLNVIMLNAIMLSVNNIPFMLNVIMLNVIMLCVVAPFQVSSLERNIFILMLGLDNAGKTCTAKSLVGASLTDVTPTLGFSKVTTKYKGFKVTLFDLGGSKSFRGIW
jgi:hypothetical protein